MQVRVADQREWKAPGRRDEPPSRKLWSSVVGSPQAVQLAAAPGTTGPALAAAKLWTIAA